MWMSIGPGDTQSMEQRTVASVQSPRSNEPSSPDSHPRLQPGVASRPTPSESGFSPARTTREKESLGAEAQKYSTVPPAPR